MRLSLHPGVWIMGGIAMTQSLLPAQIQTYRLGEIAILAGLLLFFWGIKWNGEHCWAIAWRGMRKGGSKSIEPIYIHDRLYVDCDQVQNEQGDDMGGVYSVALCLWVQNGFPDGRVLRNLQARLYFFTGEQFSLPIRGAANGVVDLRHGESAKIEIGRVLWCQPEGQNDIPAIPTTQHRKENQVEIDYASRPDTNRILKVSGTDKVSIVQALGDVRSIGTPIVLSADDVVSKQMRMHLNLNGQTSREWLTFEDCD